MIKCILFDNNGVLTTSDNEGTYDIIARYLHISRDQVMKLFALFAHDLDSGKMTQREFYQRVLNEGGFDYPINDFARIHLNAYKPKMENHVVAKELSKHYKIALLTNFGDAFWTMYPKWKLDELFDRKNVFASCDMKMAKPNEDIYLATLEKLKLAAEDILFIDDKEENIMTAKKLGFKTLLYSPGDDLHESLKKFNLK